MTKPCCDLGQRLASQVAFTERDLSAAARKASLTAQRQGQATERQLADIRTFRAAKADAADALADHVELCDRAVTR